MNRPAGLTRGLGIAGVLGVTVFWAGLAVLHVVQADLSVLHDYVSDYVNGSWGALFTVVVLAHGTGNLGITLGLAREVGREPLARLGVTTLLVATAGLFVTGLFPTDPIGQPRTIIGMVHRGAATTSFIVELLALVLLGVAFRRLPAWRAFAPATLALGTVAALALLWFLVGEQADWLPGLAERAALGTFTLWELLTAIRLVRTTAVVGSAPSPQLSEDRTVIPGKTATWLGATRRRSAG